MPGMELHLPPTRSGGTGTSLQISRAASRPRSPKKRAMASAALSVRAMNTLRWSVSSWILASSPLSVIWSIQRRAVVGGTPEAIHSDVTETRLCSDRAAVRSSSIFQAGSANNSLSKKFARTRRWRMRRRTSRGSGNGWRAGRANRSLVSPLTFEFARGGCSKLNMLNSSPREIALSTISFSRSPTLHSGLSSFAISTNFFGDCILDKCRL